MIIRRDKKNKKSKNRKKISFAYAFKKTLFVLLLACFCAVSIWTIFFSQVMEVRFINLVSNTDVISEDAVRMSFFSQVNGEYFGILPKNNLLLVRRKTLANALKEEFKLMRSVSINKEFPQALTIKVEQRESHIIWCFDGKCFFVDERGETFLEYQGEETETVKVVDLSNKQVSLNERAVDPEFIIFAENLPVIMQEEMNLKIQGNFLTPSSMSDEIKIKTQEGWEIFFSTTRNLETQIEILKKIIRETVGKEKAKDLEYVDLRIKGRAIYKFREQEEEHEEEKQTE